MNIFFIILILVAICVIFVRRYYILEKGIYLEKVLAQKFSGGISHIHMPKIHPHTSDENKERKAPSHMPRTVPRTSEAKMLYSKAMIFYERGDLDEAEKKLIQVMALDQEFADAIHRLGLIYLKQNQFSKAEALFKQLINQFDLDPIYHSNLGRALYEQEKFEEALSSYLRAIEIDGSRPARFASTAEVYRRLNSPEKAREMYEAALQLDPTNIEYLLTYAHFLMEENDMERARIYVDQVLKIQADNAVALEMKAAILRQLPDRP